MDFLNRVYEKLGLSFNISTTTNKTKKIKISISNRKIGKLFFEYLIFAAAFMLFFIPIGMSAKLSLDFFDIVELNMFEVVIINFIICTIYALIKHYLFFLTKESKPFNMNIYNRNLPSNLTPAHVKLLVDDGTVDSSSIASTILDLIDRGYLRLETSNRKSIFKDDVYIYKTDKSENDLFAYEKYLFTWFFREGKISSKMLHQQLTDENVDSGDNFATFQGLILLSFPYDKYYTKNSKNHKKIYIFSIYIFFIYLLIYACSKNAFLGGIIPFSIVNFITLFGLANFVLASPTYFLNDYGAEILDSYKDLKRYLKDFSLIHEKSSEEIALWNFYLSYSVALGIDGVASKEIKSFFGKNIYNNNNYSIQDSSVYIGMIPQIIKESKQMYEMRKTIN